jgi:hypothetical protein
MKKQGLSWPGGVTFQLLACRAKSKGSLGKGTEKRDQTTMEYLISQHVCAIEVRPNGCDDIYSWHQI